jgi:hypothetical protein
MWDPGRWLFGPLHENGDNCSEETSLPSLAPTSFLLIYKPLQVGENRQRHGRSFRESSRTVLPRSPRTLDADLAQGCPGSGLPRLHNGSGTPLRTTRFQNPIWKALGKEELHSWRGVRSGTHTPVLKEVMQVR